eukprot:TRINITY_DN3640_c0_g1_i1.p1 TRINITY_DN3640_c0_g1~~TRINITY_DN3640_c0_g1_i1.p1  ORF type:complete len:731 (+),score=236.41 TRINITY_DN3640_c0_g1_i1:64-2256(+)
MDDLSGKRDDLTASTGGEYKSYVDGDGEWKTRKISLMGVVKSFVSQLAPGQDLTRVSLPAVLLYPYSLLEVFGFRECCAFDSLLPLSKEESPLNRMFCVLRWFLSTIQHETFHKKPYNPILGETHQCWTQSKEFGRTEFIGEQVSHHPPVSGIYIVNEQTGISCSCNLSFGVKFGRNSVSVVTEGSAVLNCEKLGETYEIAKRTPDMVVKNVIIGTKKIFWNGECTIVCPKNRFTATLQFKESGSDNVVQGTLSSFNEYEEEELLYNIKGQCGGEVFMTPVNGQRFLLTDIAATLRARPAVYYQSPATIDTLDSLVVWQTVNKAIIDDDMEVADNDKKRIEQEQRERVAERKLNGTEHNHAKFFTESEQGWIPKKKVAKVPPKVPLIDTSDVELETEEEARKQTTDESDQERDVPSQRIRKENRMSTSPSESPVISSHISPNSRNSLRKRGTFRSADSRENLRPISPDGKKIPSRGSFPDSSQPEPNICSGWMKMRNSMKLWVNRYFVLRPGKLIYYKDEKEYARNRCAGILRLSDCMVKERLSNRDGASFKIYHALKSPIYDKYGLKGETLKLAYIPVSWSFCILRAASEAERKMWMTNIQQQIDLVATEDPMKHLDGFSPDEDAFFEAKPISDPIVELAENIFVPADKSISSDPVIHVNKLSKSIEKKMTTSLDELKKELDLRMVNMERRILLNYKSNSQASQGMTIKVQYWHIAVLVVLFVVSKFIW